MVARRGYYIDAPVETVFDFVKTMKWLDVAQMEVHDVKVTEEGPGTSFSWAFRMAGLRFTGFEVFSEVVPNQRITERSAGALAGTWVHTFETEGRGTRWTIELHPESFWRIPPLNRLLEFAAGRMGQITMPRFKDRIEAVSGNASRRPQAAEAMRVTRRSIHIEAPVETVYDSFFDSIKDPEKWRDLMEFVGAADEVKVTKEGTGTYMSWHMKIAGLPVARGFDVLTDVVPGKHITERSSNAMVGRWEYDFEPEGSGTKLTMEHHPQSFWRIPPLRTLMDLATERMTDSFMARLKHLIETPAS